MRLRQHFPPMNFTDRLRSRIKGARKRGASWVRLLDFVRQLPTSDGRSRLWTRIVHQRQVHQTTTFTAGDRYPELFDLAAALAPGATRILSFGCSTGEELVSLRQRFPHVQIVGAEINPRARRLASRKAAADAGTEVVSPPQIAGPFDLIFALAVLQREPHKIGEMEVRNIAAHYPFARFDAVVVQLTRLLRPGGYLCVCHSQYRVEDSSAVPMLEAISASPAMTGPLFAPAGDRLDAPIARTMFRRKK
jgi:SAM-dependent methyltransferase